MIAPRTVRPVLARVAHDLDFMTAYERADQARREPSRRQVLAMGLLCAGRRGGGAGAALLGLINGIIGVQPGTSTGFVASIVEGEKGMAVDDRVQRFECLTSKNDQ